MAVRGEAAQSVAENALARRQGIDGFSERLARGFQAIGRALGRHTTIHLFEQGVGGVAEHDMGDCLQQHPFVLGQFLGAP